jgi:hypothetical protein
MGTVVVVAKGNGPSIVFPPDFSANCGSGGHPVDNANTARIETEPCPAAYMSLKRRRRGLTLN